MRKLTLLLSILTILLLSCTKKIDGSSEETLKSSIEEIKRSLDEDKKEKFEEALTLFMFHGIDFANLLEDGGEKTFTDLKSSLDGKTANDIIAEGEKIKIEIERRKKEQAKIEIDELYEKRALANQDRLMLEKFEVKRSRFYVRKSGRYYITEEPIIELTVYNGTNMPVSRAYFTGTLASPNRSIPWLKDDFNYAISGGLEPGEEVTWSLAPNGFGEWGRVDAPKDAILTVVVNRLDGPEGEEIYSINNFGKYEQERLDELLASYPEFKTN